MLAAYQGRRGLLPGIHVALFERKEANSAPKIFPLMHAHPLMQGAADCSTTMCRSSSARACLASGTIPDAVIWSLIGHFRRIAEGGGAGQHHQDGADGQSCAGGQTGDAYIQGVLECMASNGPAS